MFSATLKHTALLLFLSHPMTGLPSRSIGLVSALFFLSASAAWVRVDGTLAICHAVMLMVATSMFGPVIATAYALLSAGVDSVAVLVDLTNVDRPSWLFSAWEVAGMGAIWFRSGLK